MAAWVKNKRFSWSIAVLVSNRKLSVGAWRTEYIRTLFSVLHIIIDAACDFLNHFHTFADVVGELLDLSDVTIDVVCDLQVSRCRH